MGKRDLKQPVGVYRRQAAIQKAKKEGRVLRWNKRTGQYEYDELSLSAHITKI
jgi:hypothetical protein